MWCRILNTPCTHFLLSLRFENGIGPLRKMQNQHLLWILMRHWRPGNITWEKVKSHQHVNDAKCARDLWLIIGNDMADRLAANILQECSALCTDYQCVIRYIVQLDQHRLPCLKQGESRPRIGLQMSGSNLPRCCAEKPMIKLIPALRQQGLPSFLFETGLFLTQYTLNTGHLHCPCCAGRPGRCTCCVVLDAFDWLAIRLDTEER